MSLLGYNTLIGGGIAIWEEEEEEEEEEGYYPKRGIYPPGGLYHQMGVYTLIWYLDKTLIGVTHTPYGVYIPYGGG